MLLSARVLSLVLLVSVSLGVARNLKIDWQKQQNDLYTPEFADLPPADHDVESYLSRRHGERWGPPRDVHDKTAEEGASLQTAIISTVPRTFHIGQKFVHRVHRYRAVIVGFTTECRESEGWIDRMGIDMLPHGRHQPFYFVSIDTRFHAAHGIPHYVAQDDIILERTTDVIQHPDLQLYFKTTMPAPNGRYEPNAKLLALYPAEADVQDAWDSVKEAIVEPDRPSLLMQMMTTNSKVKHEVQGWDESQNDLADAQVQSSHHSEGAEL